MIDFIGFPKISRLSRDIIVTEKIDGTNAQVYITDEGEVIAGSRTRWITPKEDNYGFARWVEGNRTELLKLGPGQHFGEWWGKGIQRGYGVADKRFSLFNTTLWVDGVRPEVCGVVPVIYTGPFETSEVVAALSKLAQEGSIVAPGFMDPEGVVVFHTASSHMYKKTIKKDESPKGVV